MRVHPDMNIWFPEEKEPELIEAMKDLAQPPWRWRRYDCPADPTMDEEYLFFRREGVGAEPGWSVHVMRKPGRLVVVNASIDDTHRTSVDEYVGILRQFDKDIAEPAAERVGGMTSIDTDTRCLEDYFSPKAVSLLERFCKSSNKSTLGSHPGDQEKWMQFLLQVRRDNASKNADYVHCDTFGACLRAKAWWPEEGITELVDEYEFALELLLLADKRR